MGYWTGDLTRESKRSQSNIPTLCGRKQDVTTIFTTEGKRLPFIGGTIIGLAYQLPGKPAAEPHPSQTLWLMTIMRVDVSL